MLHFEGFYGVWVAKTDSRALSAPGDYGYTCDRDADCWSSRRIVFQPSWITHATVLDDAGLAAYPRFDRQSLRFALIWSLLAFE